MTPSVAMLRVASDSATGQRSFLNTGFTDGVNSGMLALSRLLIATGKGRNQPHMRSKKSMTNYVFIESRDPFESRDCQFVLDTTTTLKQRGHEVVVFLVQNGVLAARREARGSHLPALAEAGVRLLADDFSLRERGIQATELSPGIQQSNIDALVDLLVQENTKVIWH
jgi:sulfur transfer complex TusBCD TusB component (DsrH family)